MTSLALPDELNPDYDHQQLHLDPEAFAIVHRLADAGVVTAVALHLPDELEYDQAELIAVYMGEMSRRLQWWIGDLLNDAEKRYGHEFAQLAAATGLSEGALQQRMSVCAAIPVKRRRPGLPFSVHYAVYRLGAREQEKYLKLAEVEHLSAATLRERIAADAKANQGKLVDDDPDPISEGAKRAVDHALLHTVGLAILRDARPADDGQHHLVPNEDMARLRAAYDLED